MANLMPTERKGKHRNDILHLSLYHRRYWYVVLFAGQFFRADALWRPAQRQRLIVPSYSFRMRTSIPLKDVEPADGVATPFWAQVLVCRSSIDSSALSVGRPSAVRVIGDIQLAAFRDQRRSAARAVSRAG